MAEAHIVYVVAGVVTAGLAAWVAWVLAFAAPIAAGAPSAPAEAKDDAAKRPWLQSHAEIQDDPATEAKDDKRAP